MNEVESILGVSSNVAPTSIRCEAQQKTLRSNLFTPSTQLYQERFFFFQVGEFLYGFFVSCHKNAIKTLGI